LTKPNERSRGPNQITSQQRTHRWH
jgi:hypothetical protein